MVDSLWQLAQIRDLSSRLNPVAFYGACGSSHKRVAYRTALDAAFKALRAAERFEEDEGTVAAPTIGDVPT